MSRPGLVGYTLGGRYKVEEILGQGGMSAVYKAYDPNLKRVVAIKVIHTHLADNPKFISRFEEEATAVAQLRHPNIVQVFDFNHDGDLYYMVQEFVPGETLQEHLRRLNKTGRGMPLPEAIQYTINICDAANYAHQRGMIHRDIKPANIMLDTHGQAILMDFGIVKIVGGQQHTATGAVVGTALYISPEMIRGEVPDSRSDLYSLGVTLFEMVSGRPPYEADSAMTLMMMHLNDPVPDLRGLRPAVPDELVGVIERSLAKEPDSRYKSMAEMATALKEVLDQLQPGLVKDASVTQVDQPQKTLTDTAVDEEFTPPPAHRAPVIATPSAGTVVEPPVTRREEPIRMGRSTSVGATTPPSKVDIPAQSKPTAARGIKWGIGIGGGALLLVCLAGAFLIGLRWLASQTEKVPTETPTFVDTLSVVAVVPSSSTPSPTPTVTFTASPTPAPTEIPTPTLSPTPTIPVGVHYARIKGITIDNQSRYVVDYETFEFTESLPGMHVHFFFNTVLPEEAGMPGKGPWILYGGPRPFTGYKLSDRPENAFQMCILVANADHSVQLNSGTCADLPDVVVAAAGQDTACRFGPSPEFPPLAQLTAGELMLVRGISPDELWWNVANPRNPQESCWLYGEVSTVSGDISSLPLVQPPSLAEVTPLPTLFVEITQITIDDQGRYAVEYVTQGFTEKLPGTHIHFFFNTVSPDKVGITGGGSRLMHGGPTPFTGYRTSDRPAEATQLCALVANPDHSVIPNSGNCFGLPDVAAP
jgi:serine/threonine protein kinase